MTTATHRIAGQLPLPTETRRKPRAPRGKSATSQAEALAELLAEKAAKIQETAIAEVRFYLGEMLQELAEDTEAKVRECQLAGEEHEVSDDYRAGLRFAAALVADPDVEY